MNQGFEELNRSGIKGIATFWLRLLLFGIAIAITAFSIYWCAISSNRIWLRSINSSILVANIFLVIVAVASFAFLLLCRLSIRLIYSVHFTHHVFAIISFIGQIICLILMSLSTQSRADVYYNSINDYITRNSADAVVVDFVNSHNTPYAIMSYVASRSTDLYPSISAFFGIWFAATVFYLACCSFIPDVSSQKPLLNDPQNDPRSIQDNESDHGQSTNIENKRKDLTTPPNEASEHAQPSSHSPPPNPSKATSNQDSPLLTQNESQQYEYYSDTQE